MRKKVLIINTIGMGYEGISTVILNYLRNISSEGLELHITADPDTDAKIQGFLESKGIVHIVPSRNEDPLGYLRGIAKILKSGIDVIHIHGNSGTMAVDALLAKLCGVKKIVVHSHNVKTNHPLANAVLKPIMMICADECLACSKEAGQWLYDGKPFTIMNNAIDIAGFQFNPDARKRCRCELGIENEFLIGHVGHFTEQKNHLFLIDAFCEFHKREPSSKLLLVSTGPLMEEVKEKTIQLGIEEAVLFAGRRSDVADLYSAMDMFILPSLWEGLSLVTVEAQASGLRTLVSDVVPQVTRCTDHILYKPLSDGAQSWAEEMLQLKNLQVNRMEDRRAQLAAKGFDIHMEAEKLRELYLR